MAGAATCLLDVNLLVALAWPNHVHHARAHEWFRSRTRAAWATCPVTQLGFVRVSSNARIVADAVSPLEAVEVLRRIVALAGHEFWADDRPPADQPVFRSVALAGHRQITDAYLLALCVARKARLATLDRGVPELLADPRARESYVELLA